MNVKTLLSALPPFRNRVQVIEPTQNAKDIEDELLLMHKQYETDYDRIYPYFDTGDLYSTCNRIWNFLKHDLTYKAETVDVQSSKSPAAILQPGATVDCKHYSLFAAGILDAIRVNENEPFEWAFRFASDKSKKHASHVFVVVFDRNKEILIDPVLASFNQRNNWIYEKDVSPMALVRISGVNDAPPPVTVNKQASFTNFMVEVNMNFFKFRDLINNNPSVLPALKAYCLSNNFDFNHLMLICKNGYR